MSNFFQRVENLLLFLTAYSAAWLSRARMHPVPPRNILLVAAGKLGDVVCTTPVMQAVRQNLPQARLYVEDASGLNEKLLADTQLADGFLALPGIFQSVRILRAANIDTVCMTGPSFRYLAIALIARVPNIITPHVRGGFCPQQTYPYRHLLRFVSIFPFRFGAYAPRERLRVLEPLGIHSDDTTKQLSYSDEARKNADAFLLAHDLTEKEFAVISPSAGNKIKNWPADRFARVAEHFVGEGMPVVVIGGPRDTEEVAAMMRAVEKPGGIIDASGKFSIDELKAFIARAGLFVAVDTGPIYIAEAFGVPTVDIVGPMDEREQPPISSIHKVVVPQRDVAAIHIMNARVYDEQEALRQTNSIVVDAVTKAADELLAV